MTERIREEITVKATRLRCNWLNMFFAEVPVVSFYKHYKLILICTLFYTSGLPQLCGIMITPVRTKTC